MRRGTYIPFLAADYCVADGSIPSVPTTKIHSKLERKMLTITIAVGGRTIATATATNISKLAPISDYRVETSDTGYPRLEIPAYKGSGIVRGHQRNTSVWHLVRRIALIAVKGEQSQKTSAWDEFQNELLAQIDTAPEIIRTLVAISVIDYFGENPFEKPPTDLRLSWSSKGLEIEGDGALAEKIQRDVYGGGGNEEE